jgi:hypothetical protein
VDPDKDGWATSAFDVFFEVSGAGLTEPVYNTTPLQVQTEIDCVPPQGNYIHVITNPIPLYTAGGVHVANLVTARHITYPDQFTWAKDTSCADLGCVEHVGACCDTTQGICLGELSESVCLDQAEKPRFYKDLPCGDAAVDCGQSPIGGIRLAQVSYASTHTGSVPFSEYGEFGVVYSPMPDQDQLFLNAVVDVGADSAWLVKNMVLLGQETVGPVAALGMSTLVDLGELGIVRGNSAAGTTYNVVVKLTHDPVAVPPTDGELLTLVVEDTTYDVGGTGSGQDTAAPGLEEPTKHPPKPDPKGTFKKGAWRENLDNRDVGHNQCTPASMAISLRWLAKVNNLTPLLAQNWYDTLAKLKADLGWTEANGTLLVNIVPGKLKFLQRADKGFAPGWQVKYQAKSIPGAAFPDHYVEGNLRADRVGPDAPPDFGFILSELQDGEDVEIHVGWYDQNGVRRGGHSLAVRGGMIHGNKMYIWTTDDSDQDPPGDKPSKTNPANDPGLRDAHQSQVLIDPLGYMTLTGLSAHNRVELVTSESPPKVPSGACCLPDGSCVVTSPTNCATLGGSYLGDGTTCPADEACCIPEAAGNGCVDSPAVCCGVIFSGTSQGAGSACTTELPCCLPDKSCILRDPLCCDEAGGTTVSGMTTCGGTGACCKDVTNDKFTYDSCDVQDEACCVAGGGFFQGNGSNCNDVRPCCLTNGSCADLDRECCEANGGIVGPAGSSCTGADDDGDGIDNACEGPAYENWVIADDFCLECQCDCDLNKDGVCSFLDIAMVVQCYQTSTLPWCGSADLDCDDDVDFTDIRIIVCLFQNPDNPGACCPDNSRGVDRIRWWGSYFEPFVCKGSCDCDLDNDGSCEFTDGALLTDCIDDPNAHPECTQADLDCNGVIDANDTTVWQCLFQGNPASTCCANKGTACCTKPNVDSWLVGLHRDIPPIACPPVPTGTVPVDLCGVAAVCPTDPTRSLFTPSGSAFTYEMIGAIAPFNPGDEFRVCGYIVPNVKRRCPGTIDVITINNVSDCATKHSRPSRLVAQWIFPYDVVRQRPSGKVGWDGHQVFEYTVDLPDGCLEHDYFRQREWDSATSTFYPFRNRTYWLSIQAARGHTVDAACNEIDTGKTADRDYWGWHTTPPGYQHKDDAYMGTLAMSCTDPMRWKYHWMSPLHCSDPRYRDCCDDPTKSIDMAFYLIRTRKVCVGGGLAGQPCTVDADCAVAGATPGWCVEREKIEWCQPVNPIRLTPAPGGLPPLPGGDIDEFSETVANVVINLPGLSSADLQLTGPTVVTRTNPGIEHEDIGAPQGVVAGISGVCVGGINAGEACATDADCPDGRCVSTPFAIVDIEIIAMDLRGSHPDLGDVQLTVSNIGSSGEDGVARQSTGFCVSDDVFNQLFCSILPYLEVTAPQSGILAVSDGPVQVDAALFEMPPTGVAFQSPPGAVNLIDVETGAVIGSIKSVTHTIPNKGGINLHSDVDWDSTPIDDCCEPNDTGTGCINPVCPNAADEECIPTEFHVDDNGITTVTDCDCVKVTPPAECHLVEVAGADPVCEGTCPNGLVCDPVPVAEVQADGTVKYRCPCEPETKEACCLFDGTCIEVTDPADCCAQGGTPQGPGTDCATTICPLPAPLDVGMNIDVHMDIPGEVANDFHIEGIVKSTCAPKLKDHIDGLFPNFTYSFTPLGGDLYEFKADWTGAPGQIVQYCEILHLGLLFEVCCRNVMIDLVGWWTFDGNRIGGGAVAGAIANDGYWPVVGFEVQDNLALPITTTGPQTLRLHNDSALGSPIPIEFVQLQLTSVLNPIPFDQLRVGGAQDGLPWVPVLDPSGNPVGPTNPVPMAAGDEIVVILIPAPGAAAAENPNVRNRSVQRKSYGARGTAAGGDYTAEAPLGPGEFLYIRGQMAFTGNDGGTVAGTGQELRWFFDVHEAHNLPEPEACCLEDGTCIEVIPQECICQGGRPLGAGALCDTNGDGVDDACDQTCRPTADETRCERVECPDVAATPEECQPQCIVVDLATGVERVTACDCRGADECHAESGASGSSGGGVAGAGAGDPCVVADDGSGTVTLPPAGCEYLSPDEVHEIIDGLPAGTTIELAAIHKDFICGKRAAGICTFPIIPGVDCDEVGGSLGGEQECSSSTLELAVNGSCPGDLCGYARLLSVPVDFETHIGPRTPGDPVQSFDTDMFLLQGSIFGDPDFDFLTITGGTGNGLPSPGHTTLTRLPSGSWAVDSFFDIEYRIVFQGAPGSVLDGMSGSTTGTIRMEMPGIPACKGACPPDEICVERTTVLSDGTIEVCCDCQAEPAACEPTSDGQSCEATICPDASEECVPQSAQCATGRQDCDVNDCDCQDPDACHLELVQVAGTSVARCTGGCPAAGYCALTSGASGLECRCRNKPPTPTPIPGYIRANRTVGIAFEDAAVAGGGAELAVRVKMNTLYNTDAGHPTLPACTPRVSEPDLSAYDGEWRWFGPPNEYPEDTLPAMPNLLASELLCCPYARDWSPSQLAAEFDGAGGIPGNPNVSAVYGYGEEVVPCSEYELQTVDLASCTDLTDESCYSEAVVVQTGLWGDTFTPYGLVNFQDIGAEVNKYKGIMYSPGPPESGGPPKARAALRGNQVDLAPKINFIDIGLAVEGYKVIHYKFPGPVVHCNPPAPTCP